jgi:6-phospho-3-hexuloisomerase
MPDAIAYPLRALAQQALDELRAVFDRTPAESAGTLVDAILAARTIGCWGCGREGLMMRALTMRLFHLGLAAHYVTDVTTPPLGPGDLLFVSVGPGKLRTVQTLIELAKEQGAATLAITAQPEGETSRAADRRIVIAAQTMASDAGPAASAVLPMGSAFEAAMLLFFDIVLLLLRERTSQTPEQIRARHANLE